MRHSTPEQLRFPPIAGSTVRADFEGGALSSDFGALCCVASTARLASPHALPLLCRTSGIRPLSTTLRDLLAQRIYHIASGYADGNDANSLRHDPLFKLSVERLPLESAQDFGECPHLFAS